MEEVGFAVLMLLVLAWAVVSHQLERLNVPTALVFLACGYVLANPAWGVLAVDVEVPRMHLLVETTLALLLFSDAAQVDVARLRQDLAFPARLLGIGLPLSIVLGAVGAAVLLDDLTWALAGFVGAALAPTDAALSAPVINDSRVPQRIRRVINVESGLNDGIATPVVAFTLTVAAAGLGIGGHDSSPEARAVAELALGVLVGAAVGALGVGLITACSRRGWIAGGGGRVATMAAALASFSCAIALDGNGFIAAFVAGIAFAAWKPGTHDEHAGGPESEDLVELPELVGRLLALAVWFLFGAAMLPLALDHLSTATVLYAVLSLTVFRMLPWRWPSWAARPTAPPSCSSDGSGHGASRRWCSPCSPSRSSGPHRRSRPRPVPSSRSPSCSAWCSTACPPLRSAGGTRGGSGSHVGVIRRSRRARDSTERATVPHPASRRRLDEVVQMIRHHQRGRAR